METPSSTKRMTRSQTRAALGNANNNNNNILISRKNEESEDSVSKSRRGDAKQQQDRSALVDITNDSPIVGLAIGGLGTPSSAIAKKRSCRAKNNCSSSTPGSGEALLRGQVQTLLQKIEEEEVLSKLSMENRPFLRLQGFVNSPVGLLAPTPANTPQVPNLSGDDGEMVNSGTVSVTPLSNIEEQLQICQVAGDSLESQKSLTRSLLLDFSEKSEITDSSEECSVLTYQTVGEVSECNKLSPSTDDENASNWSIQGNASSDHGEDEEVIEEKEENGGFLVDELCEGISRISVNDTTVPKFIGKRTIFLYDSEDDEIVDKVEVEGAAAVSPSVTHLKGVPTPKGKHLRFLSPEEEDEDEDD